MRMTPDLNPHIHLNIHTYTHIHMHAEHACIIEMDKEDSINR